MSEQKHSARHDGGGRIVLDGVQFRTTGYDGPECVAAMAYAVRAVNAHDALVAALSQINHMGGDERGGYCVCPRHDGSAADDQHSSGCADAYAALKLAEGEPSPTGGESRSK